MHVDPRNPVEVRDLVPRDMAEPHPQTARRKDLAEVGCTMGGGQDQSALDEGAAAEGRAAVDLEERLCRVLALGLACVPPTIPSPAEPAATGAATSSAIAATAEISRCRFK